jgi:ribosome biogenesis protein Tsr3
MGEKLIILDLLIELLKETYILRRETEKLRSKIDSRLFQMGQKFSVLNNDMLITKNRYKNSPRVYKTQKKIIDDAGITINFD